MMTVMRLENGRRALRTVLPRFVVVVWFAGMGFLWGLSWTEGTVPSTSRSSDVPQPVVDHQSLPSKHPLLRVCVARGIEAEWNDLLAQSVPAWAQTEAVHRQNQWEFEETMTESTPAGTKTIRRQNITIARDGDWHRMILDTGLGTTAVVATPQQSFHLFKRPGDTRWMPVNTSNSDHPQSAYAGNRYWIRNQGRLARPVARLDNWICDPEFTVTALEPFSENGERRMRICFDYSLIRDGKTSQRRGHLVLLPEAHWALHSIETQGTGSDGSPWNERLLIEYGTRQAGLLEIRALAWEWDNPKLNARYTSLTRIHRCTFGPTPKDKFTLADFDLVPPRRLDELRQFELPWRQIVTWLSTALALAIGLSLLAAVWQRIPVWVHKASSPELSRPYSFSNAPGSDAWKREINRS